MCIREPRPSFNFAIGVGDDPDHHGGLRPPCSRRSVSGTANGTPRGSRVPPHPRSSRAAAAISGVRGECPGRHPSWRPGRTATRSAPFEPAESRLAHQEPDRATCASASPTRRDSSIRLPARRRRPRRGGTRRRPRSAAPIADGPLHPARSSPGRGSRSRQFLNLQIAAPTPIGAPLDARCVCSCRPRSMARCRPLRSPRAATLVSVNVFTPTTLSSPDSCAEPFGVACTTGP